MKRVLIVGGAGVFGRRLAEGLRGAAGAHLILAGRSLARAQKAAIEVGAQEAAVLDRETATAEEIQALRVALVIDAAGPFQGADLRFACAVIQTGAHYLDLADARDFVASFPTLDALAREHGVAAITGASSTPALTHAVLDALVADWRRLDGVRAGIAPANQMDRGPAVMKAILTWVGAPVSVFTEGAWRVRRGWSHCADIDVPRLGMRRFALAEVPDLDLIPARFAPRDEALFMAGLEVPMMQRGLEALSVTRGWGVSEPVRYAEVLRRAGDLLWLFGSDCGGMIVEATGRDANDRPVLARWSMFAPDGQGPYTPTFAALLMAQRIIAGDVPTPGAGPCVGMLRLADFEPIFARHAFSTQIDVVPLRSPVEAALDSAFERAPPAVRNAHRGGPVTRLRGEAQVMGEASPIAALFARLFGMPGAAERVPVEVTMRLSPAGEVWTRRFGARRMRSRLRVVRSGVVRERFGPFDFDMKVSVDQNALSMTIIGWRIGSIPLPAFLAPRSTATESMDARGRFRFDVPIALPLIGRLTHYSGWLVAEEVEAEPAPSERETA